MELDEKTLRKFFLEALDQTVMPQLEMMHKRFDEMDDRFDRIEAEIKNLKKELLELSEFTIPRINEMQENMKFIAKELNELDKGGGRKRTAQEIRGLETLISRLKKEIDKVNTRIVKFEKKLKLLQQSQKRKAAR